MSFSLSNNSYVCPGQVKLGQVKLGQVRLGSGLKVRSGQAKLGLKVRSG